MSVASCRLPVISQHPKPCQHQRHVIPGQHQRHVIPGNIEKKFLFFNVDPESIQPVVGCQFPVASYQSAPKAMSASTPCYSGATSAPCHSGQHQKKELFFNVDPESIAS
ncbi:hypothetical protein QUF72_01310 [Desulfobacterales bacterium HSG2]|nr:hypothetical protein [Desulfobacterales bacterium HSG2]